MPRRAAITRSVAPKIMTMRIGLSVNAEAESWLGWLSWRLNWLSRLGIHKVKLIYFNLIEGFCQDFFGLIYRCACPAACFVSFVECPVPWLTCLFSINTPDCERCLWHARGLPPEGLYCATASFFGPNVFSWSKLLVFKTFFFLHILLIRELRFVDKKSLTASIPLSIYNAPI